MLFASTDSNVHRENRIEDNYRVAQKSKLLTQYNSLLVWADEMVEDLTDSHVQDAQ